jgi:DNA-binding transcriptional MerR regulator
VHCQSAPRPRLGCIALAEYRLDDLARVSGVSARNIRAYRERGLLDPPRRVGRSAYYDDYHLSQLRTINQLLRKGFNSAHIAEFFTSMRQGADLADILGIQRAVLGPRTDESAEPANDNPLAVDISVASDEARRLLDHGLAELDDGAVVLLDAKVAAIVARSSDQLEYVRAILRIVDATRDTVDVLAGEVVRALMEGVALRFGVDHVPKSDEIAELGALMKDYRELGSKVVSDRLDASVREQVLSAVSDYTQRN